MAGNIAGQREAIAQALRAGTVCEAFQTTAAAQPPDAIALRSQDGRTEVTWGEYQRRVRAIAAGLHAIGMRSGNTLAMMLTNRPEFNLVDTATMHLGVTSFSLYNTLSGEQLRYQVENSGAQVIVTEPQFIERVLAVRTAAVHTVVLVEGTHPAASTLSELETSAARDFDFETTWRAVQPTDVLTLIYTSGTTGTPKGVELTHSNVQSTSRGVAALLPPNPCGRTISYLPAAHIGERWCGHYYPSVCLGATLTAVSNLADLPTVLRDTRPTFLMLVPRILEKLQAALETVGGVADPSVLSEEAKTSALAMVGLDKAEWVATGGGPVNPKLLEFYSKLDLNILESWGMSETAATIIFNPLNDIRTGAAGKMIANHEARLLDDGELLVRGPSIMKGYRNDPERTAEALDADGWLHTGDIAKIDGEGYISIVDRKKEIIINSMGKNMSPVAIEFQIKSANPLIGQAVCIGDGRRYNVALIVLDPDAAKSWASEHGLAASTTSLTESEELVETIATAIEQANTHLSRVEQIRKFKILPGEWLPAGDELTPTSKLKRKPIEQKYADVIEQLYAD
jgi:long-subunit acyl-CoA synthetase (AMP-forming)